MKLKRLLCLSGTALILTACTINIQIAPTADVQQQAVATVVALTLQALSPVANVPAASPAAAATATPTYSKPVLTITGDSNCRTGPGASFSNVTSFTPGTKLELVGQDTADNYWQVKIPNSQDTCWVWGQYATASGTTSSLPESTPVVAASAPGRPGSLFFSYTCPFGNLTTVLTWADSADNETGYHVYRFDLLIADLPADSTTYTDVVTVSAGSALQYSVEAYNSAGASARRTVNFACK